MKYKLPHLPGIEIDEEDFIPIIITLAIAAIILVIVVWMINLIFTKV